MPDEDLPTVQETAAGTSSSRTPAASSWRIAKRRLLRALAGFRVYRNPSIRILDYLGLVRSRRVEVALRNGLRFNVRLRTGDFGILDEVFSQGIYNRALERIEPGHLVLDVGAHAGIFALAAARRGATVLCFEPLPDNVELLKANTKLNGFDARITVCQSAVAAVPGTMELFTLASDTGGSTFFPATHPAWKNDTRVKRLSVPCVTLHEIVHRHRLSMCDCLKMDCEGAEFDIVERAAAADLQRFRMIILEYHPINDVGRIRSRLEQLGFAVDVSDNPCILWASS